VTVTNIADFQVSEGPPADPEVTSAVRAIVGGIVAECIPPEIAAVHWRTRAEVTDEQLAAFDRAYGAAERRCIDELADYDNHAVQSAILDSENLYLTGVDFLLRQTTFIRAVIGRSAEQRVHSLVGAAVMFGGAARVGYSAEEFAQARAAMPLEMRRQAREGWADGDLDRANAWLDRFDPTNLKDGIDLDEEVYE
jgi:hypothetical protein